MSHIQSHSPDLEILKDIPGYHAILKAVLKNQIQYLVEQLSEQTGEESVLLTASVTDGTLSHLGSSCGKFFLQDHEEFESKFWGFCLKRKLKRKQDEDIETVDNFTSFTKRQRFRENICDQSSVYSHSLDVGISPSVSQSSKKKRALSTSDLVDDETPECSYPTVPEEEKVITSDITKSDIEQDLDKGISVKVSDFLVNINKDNASASSGDESEVRLAADLIQKPEDDSEKNVVCLETVPAVFEKFQLINSFNTNKETCDPSKLPNRVLQTHGRLSKVASTSMTSDPYSDIGNPSLNLSHMGMVQRFECPICGKTLAQKSHLPRHMRIHTGEKPFSCKICGKRFTQKQNMKAHAVVHYDLTNKIVTQT